MFRLRNRPSLYHIVWKIRATLSLAPVSGLKIRARLLSLAPVSGLSQALTCLYTLQINPEIPALYRYVCRTRSRYLHELVEQGSEA